MKPTVVYTFNIHVIIIKVIDIFHFISSNSGFNMGIKLFIIDYVYHKFPKVKRKYDSGYKLWKSLPTRREWEWTHVQSHIDGVSYLIREWTRVQSHIDDVSYLISNMLPLHVDLSTTLVDIVDKTHVYTFVLYYTY